MTRYALSHLADSTLLHDLAALVAKDRATTADLLAHLAEVDARRLYLPAAYPSLFAYCVHELHMSEDAAAKRIQAARATRRFPAIFAAVADGRLHLTGVGLLAPHLTEDTAGELLAAAAHKTKSEIELLLAHRFPRPDVLAWVEPLPSLPQHAPAHVELPLPSPPQHAPAHVETQPAERAPEPVTGLPPVAVSPAPPVPGAECDRSRVKPLAPQRFAVQFTMGQGAHDKLRYAQELLGHQVRSGDIAAVFERALDALIPQLEKQKFAATDRPRRARGRRSSDARHVPADVRRAVWRRDGGRCTFVSDAGRRCPARRDLQFDHAQEFARGGEASVAGIRLRCRAHNHYQAECTYGAEFMRRKRLAAAERRIRPASRPAAGPPPAG